MFAKYRRARPCAAVAAVCLCRVSAACWLAAHGPYPCAQVWDKDFVKVDDETLFNLILAANYLDIKSLLDLTVRPRAPRAPRPSASRPTCCPSRA